VNSGEDGKQETK